MNHTLSTIDTPPVPLAEIRMLIGDGARALLVKGLGDAADKYDLDRLFEVFVEYYECNIAVDSYLFPGALSVVDAAKAADIRCAVCTNKYVSLARRLLEALNVDDRFDVVLGGDSVTKQKPAAEHIHATLDALGVASSRAVMIGDSANDINAAKAAGLPSIAVSFGYTLTPAKELGADRVIDHFDELPDALLELA